ncbi:MAG: heavy metal transporter [Treponema sp.]|nr:heavy metal transporter [Treponema sp.]
MQKKIYVAGMDDDATAAKVDAAVKAVAGVTNVVSSSAKCQVCVDFDGAIDDAINAAIASTGVVVLG